MPDYIIFNPSSATVPNRTLRFERSLQEYQVTERGLSVVLWPPGTPVPDLSQCKVLDGAVVPLTQADRDALAAAHAADVASSVAQQLAQRKAAAHEALATDSELREAVHAALETVFELLVPQINSLRSRAGLAVLDQSQMVALVKQTFASNFEGKVQAWK